MKLIPLFPDPAERASRRRRRLVVSAVAVGMLAATADGALLGLRHWWPQAQVIPGTDGLAEISIAGYGEQVESVRVVDRAGNPIGTKLEQGLVEPVAALPQAAAVRVTVVVKRSHWLGWLLGERETISEQVRTPASVMTSDLVHVGAGKPVRVRFSEPVRVVTVRRPDGKTTRLVYRSPRRSASLGITATGADMAGSVFVSGAPRTWERLPAPTRLTWFPADSEPKVLVRPAPKTLITPASPLVLTFSQPVRTVLGGKQPRLVPAVRGTWRTPNAHTLVFQPSGLGFPLGRSVKLRLPAAVAVISGADPTPYTTLTWRVPGGSPLRMKQLLAKLGYLPLAWEPTGRQLLSTTTAEARASVSPPPGRFTWRYPKTPAKLKELWESPETRAVVMRGAIMAFESSHGLPTDGYPTHAMWKALLRDELAGKRAPMGYSYVFVSESLPQKLTLWHNGRRVLETPVNTGVASRPTELGTFPVYLHLVETTMVGTNPDGTPYNDPGVPWVNYFNGGDAVHGFPRSTYGWPQSVGCVETPISTAEQIFPYVQVGTLVTVAA